MKRFRAQTLLLSGFMAMCATAAGAKATPVPDKAAQFARSVDAERFDDARALLSAAVDLHFQWYDDADCKKNEKTVRVKAGDPRIGKALAALRAPLRSDQKAGFPSSKIGGDDGLRFGIEEWGDCQHYRGFGFDKKTGKVTAVYVDGKEDLVDEK